MQIYLYPRLSACIRGSILLRESVRMRPYLLVVAGPDEALEAAAGTEGGAYSLPLCSHALVPC